MEYLFLWFMMVYGMSNILVYGSIFNGPRDFIRVQAENDKNYFKDFFVFLRDMLSCMMCTPVWVGFFVGIFVYSPFEQHLGTSKYVSWFFDGIFASGITWTINSIVEWFEENRPKN